MGYYGSRCRSFRKKIKRERKIIALSDSSTLSVSGDNAAGRHFKARWKCNRMRRNFSKRELPLQHYGLGHSESGHDTESYHEIDVYILSLETVVLRIRFPSRSMSIRISDFLCLREGALLNDIIIDFYINHIAAHLLPDDSMLKLHLFPSLFWCHIKEFGLFEDELPKTYDFFSSAVDEQLFVHEKTRFDSYREKLSQIDYWLEEENVFDADFLVLPVNHNHHWSLVVVCSPSLSLKRDCDANTSDSAQSPVVIIFDSQQPVDPSLKSHIVLTTQRFLELAFTRRASSFRGSCFKNDRFKCVIPENLPQQGNNVDCGVYILEYARRFLLSPPSIDYLQSGVFDFLSLYPDFDVSGKRCEIQHTVLSLCSDYDIWRNLLNTVDVPFEYENRVVYIQR